MRAYDNCKTADDVYQKLARVHRFRQHMFPRPKPKVFQRIPKPTEPEPPPEPSPPPPPPEPQVPITEERLSMRFICDTICRRYDIAEDKVLSHSRQYKEVDVRHLIAALIYILLPEHSRANIGRFMLRDHTTIMHGLDLYERTLETFRNTDLSTYTFKEIANLVAASMQLEAIQNGRRAPQI